MKIKMLSGFIYPFSIRKENPCLVGLVAKERNSPFDPVGHQHIVSGKIDDKLTFRPHEAVVECLAISCVLLLCDKSDLRILLYDPRNDFGAVILTCIVN